MSVRSVKELMVYSKSYELAMRVFNVSTSFPVDERFSLTSQIRRASRSVTLNLREAWAKRRYVKHFVMKLTDCDGENAETDTALDFALDCGYLSVSDHEELTGLCREIGKMLGAMINKPDGFVID